MIKSALFTSAALAVSILAAPAVTLAASVDGTSSNETSTTTASESSNSGSFGTGTDKAGATVTATNMAFDHSLANIVGAKDTTDTQGGDQGSITGSSFSMGTGFNFGSSKQTGTSTGSDSGHAFTFHK
jgi:hypothetical protein